MSEVTDYWKPELEAANETIRKLSEEIARLKSSSEQPVDSSEKVLLSECCDRDVTDNRFCPKCGWECRVKEAPASFDEWRMQQSPEKLRSETAWQTAERAFNAGRPVRQPEQPEGWSDFIAKELHYPEHWDTMAYPTVYDAIHELASCSECAPKRESGWQPIATAPQDGREILLYIPTLMQSPVAVGCVNKFGTVWHFYEDDNENYGSVTTQRATHWMPKPPNPTEIEVEEK